MSIVDVSFGNRKKFLDYGLNFLDLSDLILFLVIALTFIFSGF